MNHSFFLFHQSHWEYRRLFLAAFLITLHFGLFAQTPIAHYPLNGNANDAGSNGLNGNIIGTVTPTTDRFGNANSAMQFGGSGQVDIGGNLADQNFSVSIWLKPGSSQFQYANILDNNHTGFQNWVLQQDGSTLNRYVFGVHRSDGGIGIFFNLQTDVWQHVVVVKSATAMEAYINGVLDQTTAWSGTVNYVSPFLRLGNWAGGGRPWNGGMDEVKYFNTAINQSQVTALFNEGSPQPIAHYPFSGNANDAVGSLNGTVNGATLTTDRFGNANSAYSFDGVDDFIGLNHNFGPFTELTVSAWYKVAATSPDLQAIVSSDASGKLLHMQVATDFVADNAVYFSGGPTALLSHPQPVLNQWRHVVITAKTGESKLYINGDLVDTKNLPFTQITAADLLRIGSGFQNGRFFNGAIDDVKIYNTALSAVKVQAEFNGSNSSAQQKPGSGNAIRFDGGSQQMNATQFTTTPNNFTMEAWVNPNSTTTLHEQSTGGAQGTTGNNQFVLFPLHGNALGSGSQHAGAGFSVGTNGICVYEHGDFYLPVLISWAGSISGWTHVSVVYTNKQPSLYVNGILVATGLTSSKVNVFPSSSEIGGGAYGHINGSIDEVRIWNTPLTQTQIRDRMCRKITSGDALFSNLVAYYNFDESTGNTAFDGTFNAIHGTLTSGATRVTSGAAIGNTSAHNYVSSGLPSANLSINGQDNLAVAYTAGAFSGTAGTHVYAVSEKPNTESGIENPGTNDRYFGVFNAGLTNPQYNATYNYTGNPFVTGGNESQLALFKRNDNAGTTWTNAAGTLNTTANTLTTTGQSTEYVLGIGTCSPPPVPTITSGGQTSFCANASLGLVSSAATNNQWLKDGVEIAGATSNTFTATEAGTYAVRVSAGSCSSTSSNLVLTTLPVPTVSISTSAPGICPSDPVVLSTTGTALSAREWLLNGASTNQFGTTFSASTAGTYSVIGTAANGCKSTSAGVSVQADAVPALTSDKPANTICSGTSIQLTSTPGASFLWSTGATTSTITVSPGTTTNFSVQTTGLLGCVFNNEITVTVVPSLTPGAVSNMLPDNGSINQENAITFSWQPASNAISYDLYVWPAPGSRPANPNQGGLVTISANLNNLAFGSIYNYQVVSRSACQTTDGPIQQFTTRSLPDLVVSNVQAQAFFDVPAMYQVTYTVTNQGTGVSLPGTWKDKLFLSLDSAEGSDIELQIKDNINALAPGASYNGSFQLVVDQVGEYFLYVKTDATGLILETNKGNNVKFRNPGRVLFQELLPKADLVSGFGGITTNPNAIAGGSVQFNYLVKNIGNARAIGQASLVQCGPPQCDPIDLYWEDFAFISTDSSFGPNAIPIGRVKVNPRKAKASVLPDCEECNGYYSKSKFLEIDSSMVASSSDLVIPHNISGKAFLIVKMNEGEGKFEERFRQNNVVISKGFNVILRPPADLEVNTVLVTPASSQQGNFAKVKYRIRNIGVNSPITTEMQWTDKVYLSTTSVLNKNTALVVGAKTFPLSFLGNNATYDDSVTFQIPFLAQTPLFVFVETDANNLVFEHTFKANNLSSAQQVNLDLSKKPDYVTSAFSAPTSVQAGSPISASYTVTNSGNANGAGNFESSFRIKLVGSADAPQPLASVSSTGLLIGGTAPIARTLTIPANMSPGQYELSAFADAGQTQTELNESNNIQTRTITVSAAPSFDLAISAITAPSTVDIFQNQPSFQVACNGTYNVIQSGPGLPDEILVKIKVSRNADGSELLYSKNVTIHFPGGIPTSFTIPAQTIQRNTVPEGNYFVVVELVPNSSLEPNVANNLLTKPIFFETSPVPDIVFQTHPATLTLTSGQSFSIPLEIKNTGMNELGGLAVTKAVLTNSPSIQNQGFQVLGSSAKIPGIFLMPTNVVIKDTIRGAIPLSYSGNYFLQLIVEADNKTYEGTAGEANNVVVIPIVISPPVLPDLTVDPLVLPANIEAGRRVAFNYTLRNIGAGSFSGFPKNNFRLSKTGVFNPATDGEVGTDQPSVSLAAGANLVSPAALRANGLLPGAYKPGAFVNSTFTVNESNFSNNETYGSTNTTVFVNPLNLDVLASESNFIGDYFYRSVNMVAGLDILAEFSGGAGFASKDKVPTASNAEFTTTDNQSKEIIIPNSEAGQYFFGVVPNSGGSVNLKVRAIPFSILSLSPNRVGKGNATTEIKGAAFTNQTIFVLRNGSGVNVDTGTIRILRNSMQARVTFHCGNLPIDFYTVRAIKPGNEFTDLVNGLQVVAKSASSLVATNTMPEEVNGSATVPVNYVFTNAGNTDVENGFGRLSLPLMTKVKNIVISSNADGYRSFLAKTGIYDLDHPLDYQVVDLFAIIPAWKRNLAPGESFQISFEMETFSTFSELLVGTMAQDLETDQFHDMIATEVEKIRGLSIQTQSEIDNSEILDSLGGYWSFQHLAVKNLLNSGFYSGQDVSEISQRPYYPSIYQSGTMKGYGIVYDIRVMQDLSLRYICEAPLTEYNLSADPELFTYYANGAMVSLSSNYRRSAQDLIQAACAGDTNEFKRRIAPLKNGGGFEGDLATGYAYGPSIYTNIFGEYRPGQPFVPGQTTKPQGTPSILSEGGGFWGNIETNNSRDLFSPPPPQRRPPPPPPATPVPSDRTPDPLPSLPDLSPPDYKNPNPSCANIPMPSCVVKQTGPKKIRCKTLYTVCTFTFCNQNHDALAAFCYPNLPFADQKCVKVKYSCDPNEIEGPEGVGDSKFVAKTDVLPYTIRFENDPEFADAAASTVRIVQPLDANFEQGTFRLKQFGFDNRVFDVPAGQSSFSTQIDLSIEKGIKVNVLGTIDIVSKQLFWQFVTVDAATGQTSMDPSKGFLPVNDSTGKGEGFVSYTIQPGLSTQTGDSLRAQAEIIFDFNDAILTNRHFNVVDALPPVTTVSTPSGTQTETDFALSWTTQDDEGGSGAESTWIFFKKDGGALDTLGQFPADTGSIDVAGFETGHSYGFFFRSQDRVKILEELPTEANITITIGTLCNLPTPTILVGGPLTFCQGGSVILTSSAQHGNRWNTGDTTQSITVTVSDTITLQTVAAGCSSAVSGPVVVVVNPLPAKPVITASGPLVFCQGGSVTLTTNAAPGHRWSTGSTLNSINVISSITVADTARVLGCKTVSDPVTVSVNPLPVVNAGLDVLIEAGQSASLTATGAATYQWSPLQNITPANGIGASVSVNPNLTTLYTVTGIDGNNCFATDAVLVTVSGGSGPLTAPQISPATGTFSGPQMVTITSTSPGAEIYYTTSGNLPVLGTGFTKLYTAPFQLIQSATVRAMAVKSGQANSPVAVSFITITNPGVVSTPVISPGAGSFEGSVSVSMSTSTSGAEIWYTTNGNSPRLDVPNSFTKLYTGPITLFGTTTVKAMGVKTGLINSAIASSNFVVNNPAVVAAPTFSPAPGIYATAQTVTISCATPGAQIYFSNNGITPSNTTPAARLYSTLFVVGKSGQIKAIAFKDGLQQSVVSVGTYTIGPGRINTGVHSEDFYFESDEYQVLDQELKINLVPNPGMGRFYILAESATEPATISVVNLLGQTIWEGKMVEGQTQLEIDITRHAAGIYSLKYTGKTSKKEIRLSKY